MYFQKLRRRIAFTLVELIVVIAILAILASIVLLIINPATIFISSRNANRAQDFNTYQAGLTKYLADSKYNTTSNSLDDFSGISTLYSSATSSTPYGNCPGLATGNLTIPASSLQGFQVTDNSSTGITTGNPNVINIQPLINGGYVPKTLIDPLGGSYNACIDTTNANTLMFYSGNVEGSIKSYPIIPINPDGLPSIVTGVSNPGSGGGGSTPVTTSYNCPTGSVYSSGSCTTTYSSSIFGTTGSNPNRIAIDSSGNIYTSNYGSNNVSKITTAGVSSILGTTGTNPHGITIDFSGNVYTANSSSNNVSKITPAGVSSILGTTGANPYDLLLDPSNNVYTANFNSSNVSKITPAGISSILGTTGSGPDTITTDLFGNIYIANLFSNNVSKITPAGVSSILGTTAGSNPYGITIDVSGNIYTVNSSLSNVSKITPAGITSILGTTASNSLGITIDSFGNIYTTNYGSNNVSKITPAGVSSTIASTGLYPFGITIDSSGNIYSANYNSNNVSKLTLINNAVLTISPSTIKINQGYTLGLNNVISSGSRVNSGTCSIQVSDVFVPASPIVLQTLSSNMVNGACKPVSFNAVTNTHPLSIQATISATSQTFTYTTIPQ